MKTPHISLDRLPEIILKAKLCQASLQEFRILLELPEETPVNKLCQHAEALASYRQQLSIKDYREQVESGERPRLVDAIKIVMGDETLDAHVILTRLTERGWEPGASNKPSYISYTLSDNPKIFKRGRQRGTYRVIPESSLQGTLKTLIRDSILFPDSRALIKIAPATLSHLNRHSPRGRVERALCAEVSLLSVEDQLAMFKNILVLMPATNVFDAVRAELPDSGVAAALPQSPFDDTLN